MDAGGPVPRRPRGRLRVGRRLAHLGRSAGLTVEAFRGWFEIMDLPPGAPPGRTSETPI
ncbi:MAG TPA: hypothetical protein VFO16_02955 [Pseudonocardiaceae bacterium]|nr:hypothetical protein [Pseudonocardiaceae bacterium]